MERPGTPKPNLAGSESGENLPEYLRPGKLHWELTSTGGEDSNKEMTLQFRTNENEDDALIVAGANTWSSLKHSKFLKADLKKRSNVGLPVTYHPYNSDQFTSVLENAGTTQLISIVETLNTKSDTAPEGHPSHLLNKEDKEGMIALINGIIEKRKKQYSQQ